MPVPQGVIHIYGFWPVPSWRFGRSLGIDVLAPPKKCTFTCVYCQFGRTKIHLTGLEELDQPFIGVDQVLSDLEETLKRINVNTVDIVTYSGIASYLVDCPLLCGFHENYYNFLPNRV
jgi:wyosine [tRNA(Phe)-imidazoG37] synthetase (radical SAM superfamily)